MTRSFDYIVVGSGSAGSIVARRLSETGASVLLVEAGRRDNTQLARKPGMIGPLHSVPQLKKILDWGHYTVPQSHALNRKIPQTHGKVLGGSSSVNGMVFVRGNHQNYDDWAAEGNTGWSFEDVLPSFKRFETFEDGANAYRGGSGPIKVTRALLNAALDGSLKHAPMVIDPNFGFEVPTECEGVPTEILNPRETWADKAAYDAKARHLVNLFIQNFAKFEDYVDEKIRAAAPTAA